jgi:hypothetical protein
MYIEAVPNRNSPPAILLRESYRDDGKVKKRTLLNLSDWPPELIEGFKAPLKGGAVVPEDQPIFTIKRRCPTAMSPPSSARSRPSASIVSSVPPAIATAIW